MTATKSAPAAKTTRKPRAAKASATKASAPDVTLFADILTGFNKADVETERAKDELQTAQQKRDAQVIAFVDRYRTVFGQEQKSFTLIQNNRDATKRGEHCLAFREQVASALLSAEDLAILRDPAHKWTRTENGKRLEGPAWGLDKKITNWISRLLADALPILSGEVELIEDADGNKAKAKRAPRTTKPKVDQWIGKIGDVVKAMKKDKASPKPEASGHAAHIKALEAAIKAMTVAWK